MFVGGRVAHAGVELLEFVHRGELVGVPEDAVDQRESRLLSDEVDEFARFHPRSRPQVGAHTIHALVASSSLLSKPL
jgi:hypothetical protein